MFSEEFKRAFRGDELIRKVFYSTLKKKGLVGAHYAYALKYLVVGAIIGMAIEFALLCWIA